MTNKDFDKLLNYWGDEKQIIGLLLEPLELAAEIHRSNPELKSRERHLHFLRNDCLGGYVVSECERIFGTKDWEALSTGHLIELSNHLRARPNALVAATPRREMETAAGRSRHDSDPDWTV